MHVLMALFIHAIKIILSMHVTDFNMHYVLHALLAFLTIVASLIVTKKIKHVNFNLSEISVMY